MSPGKNEDLIKKNNEWMLSGEYGTIQFIENNYCSCSETLRDIMNPNVCGANLHTTIYSHMHISHFRFTYVYMTFFQ